MTFFHTYLLRPCLVGTGFVMFLMTVDVFAHQRYGVYETPELHECSADSYDHVGVHVAGGRGNPDTTLVLGGPAVRGELIVHHHLSWERPHLAYYFDIDVPREGILHAVVTGSFVELSTQWGIELGTFWWDYIESDGRLGRHVPCRTESVETLFSCRRFYERALYDTGVVDRPTI